MSDSDDTATGGGQEGETYQVLARKYRPADFDALIGQEAMVRTLRNAFETDRIAHAFILTGVRGVGKTTTARIIAKGLNCVGPDGAGGPTVQPCGQCEPCQAIADSRHVDVLEMDAASRTGVGDIREIIDSVRYRAASARYKVYIIDEVHMLSTSAFNALLKTLEEPPPHVIFIFATTEIRKVPVTVLSRCQRFDLRRIEPEVLMGFLAEVAGKESAQIAEDALALITRAAEGSVRDALSLLDQAIAHGAGETSADQVRAMLGLADRGRVLDLFDLIMKGDAKGALAELSGQYSDGADPLAVLRDLAELTHWISTLKIDAALADDPTIAPDERARGREMADGLSMRALARAWQMLLKALEEVANAPNAMMAAEMAVIRLTHVAELPSPEDILRKLTDTPPATGPDGPQPSAPGGGSGAQGNGGGSKSAQISGASPSGAPSGGPVAQLAAVATPDAQPTPAPARAATLAAFARFEDVVALIRAKRDVKLLTEVEDYLRLVRYQPGMIEFQPAPGAPNEFPGALKRRLEEWTQTRWVVSVVSEGGAETLTETARGAADDLRRRALEHPLVLAALEAFPGIDPNQIKAAPPPDPLSTPGTEPDMDGADFGPDYSDGDFVDQDDPYLDPFGEDL